MGPGALVLEPVFKLQMLWGGWDDGVRVKGVARELFYDLRGCSPWCGVSKKSQ